ncbi:MAG: hypothetical protein RBU37_09190 [Myxococcota bacterium]|nr:hypothetical protein [Myxococcota bacterium]
MRITWRQFFKQLGGPGQAPNQQEDLGEQAKRPIDKKMGNRPCLR